ncbi:MAG: hypothetical protein LC623_01610 [Halobacteriales archaeon]|nr:hypothetical protein [Halobacteriales archaeon]
MAQTPPTASLLDEPRHAGFRASLPPADQHLLDALVAEGRRHAPSDSFAAALHAATGRLEQSQRFPRRGQTLTAAPDATPVPA